jgi:glycosyltransferase involved in cell wall biosynthesis
MNVAILGARNSPARHGGLEVVVERIATELATLGCTVTVIAAEGEERNEGGVNVQLSGAVKSKYLHSATQMLRTLRLLRRQKWDVVNIHGVGPAFVVLFFPRYFRTVPVLVTCHGLDWERSKWPPLAQVLFRQISLASLRRVQGVSAVSAATSEALQRQLSRRVRVIPNGVDPAVGTSVVRGSRVSLEFDLPDRYSILVSRLTPEKNIEAVLRVYDTAVTREFGPLFVVGGGGGSYASRYEEGLRRRVQGDVRFLGPMPHSVTLDLLGSSGLFISLSTLEAQPISVMEAMAAGVPMLLSDIAAHRELADGAALFVQPDSPTEIRNKLLDCRAELGGFGRLAAEKAEAMTWPAAAEHYAEWFRSVVAARGV